MKLQEEQIRYIKDAFSKMKSKEDFLSLLNYCKIIVYGEKTITFELKHINYHSNPKANRRRYVQFSIKKKSGAERIIHAPNKGLKAIQRCLNIIFQTIYNVNPSATGFVPGKSIVDNAMVHISSLYVYNIDLKDFFPSIDQARIWGRLKYPPFNLNEKNGTLALANIITALCCHEILVERLDENNEWQKVIKNVLPQGAPTSPTLTNIICQKLDFYLSAVAKRYGLRYSRYADDITFSSLYNVFQKESDFQIELHRIIAEQNFTIKDSKTRLQKKGYRQEVTGLLVNENVNVQKRYVKQLRMWIYYWERYGYEKASTLFLPKYILDKGQAQKGKPDMANVISGKLDYLKMVKGWDNVLYLKLQERFDSLIVINKDEVIKTPSISLDNILPIVDLKNTYTTKEVAHQQLTNRLRININLIDSAKKEVMLKRNIIIEKGKILPIEEFLNNNENEEKPSSVIKNHRPKETKLFLSLFNNSEGLKYLTHKFNEGKRNYDDFIVLCKGEFDKAKSEYPNVPDAVLRRIEEFAFAPNPEWFIRKGNEKIFPKKGWSEASFVEWYNKETNMHPGFDSKWNNEMIIPFKESIEVRAGNLKTIIEEILITGLGTSKSNFIIYLNEQSINTAEFYTDVDKIKFALSHIIAIIKDRADENFCFEIEIDFVNESLDGGNFKNIIITHINSEPTKHSNDKDFVKGDMKSIQSNLWGLCNYEIVAKFPEGFRKKIILTDNYNDYKNYVEKGESIVITDSSKVKGFTHILKFY